MTPEPETKPVRQMNFFQTMRAVAWAFVGMRQGSASRQEAAKLNPVHLVIAGILGAAIFVVVLISVVRLVLSRVV